MVTITRLEKNDSKDSKGLAEKGGKVTLVIKRRRTRSNSVPALIFLELASKEVDF